MKYNNYFLKVLIFFLIFIGAFHAYSGVLSVYLFFNEYLNDPNTFSYEAWREYVSNGSQFVVSKFLVKLGINLGFIEESKEGDLAFFDNEEGEIIHVGILLKNNYIIHASGHVKIDRIDQTGIYNLNKKKHTHKLRTIKNIIDNN